MTITTNKRRKGNTKKSAVFGVAMSSLFIGSEIQADILDITWDGGNESVSFELSSIEPVNIDQLFGATDLRVEFYDFTNTFSGTFIFARDIFAAGYVSSVSLVSPGTLLDPETFGGQNRVDFASQPGNPFVGFKTLEGNVGWFRIAFQAGTLTLTAGELATAGEKLSVGLGGTQETLLGDANCDGVTNLLDVAPFVEQISGGTFVDKSDLNRDGVVNLLDVGPFVALLNGAGTAIVENGQLRVRTTTSDDVITVARVVDKVRVTVNGTQLGDFDAVDRILIDARQGNDTITVQPTIELETQIYAGPGDDIVFGGSGVDNIYGAQGDDTIFGRDGDDYIVGAAGDNEIYGQNGNDLIYGGQVAFVSGGSGDDTIFGGSLADEISGDSGDDVLNGGPGDDVIRGGLGNDTIRGRDGNDTLMGDAGIDTIDGDAGMDTIYGGLDDDVIDGGFDADMVFGEDGDDVITGAQGDDILSGGGGDDLIEGLTGRDIITGDAGDDMLFGTRMLSGSEVSSNDLFGGSGNDILDAGSGGDLLFGESGIDELLGDSGEDMLNGGPQDDLLLGGGGDDDVFGAGGDDVLAGEAGSDFLNGGADTDTALDFGETGHINIEIDPP